MEIDPDVMKYAPLSELEEVVTPSADDFFFLIEGGQQKKSKWSNVEDKISSGIKGEATTTTVPSATGFYRYIVHEAGTYTNFKDASNASIVVSTADLEGNMVFLEVTDNVAKKVVIEIPMPELSTMFDPLSTDKAETGKTISDYLSIQKDGVDNMLKDEYLMDKTVITSFGEILTNMSYDGYKSYVGIPVSHLVGQQITVSGFTVAAKDTVFKQIDGVTNAAPAEAINTNTKTFTVPAGAHTFNIWVVSAGESFPSEIFLNEGSVVAEPAKFITELNGTEVLNPASQVFSDSLIKLDEIANLERSPNSYFLPRDKTSELQELAGDGSSTYGFSDTFFSYSNAQNLIINAKASGNYRIDFRDENLNLIHTYIGSASTAGKITLSILDLGIPNIENYVKIYPFVGNLENKTPNVFMFSTNDPQSREWWLKNGSTPIETYTNTASFNFWLELNDVEKIVQKVNEIDDIIKNFPLPSEIFSKYNYQQNYPILPKHLFITDESPAVLYKSSMFQKTIGQYLPNMMLLSDNNVIEINDPTSINSNEVGSTAKIVVEAGDKIIYKDISILSALLADKTGKTVNVMSLGDSLTEGNQGFTSSPIFLLKQMLQSKGITVNGVGTLQRTSGATTIRYEGRGGWRYRTFVGLESQFAGINVTIPSPTKNVWVEGVDGAMGVIKANNPFLYVATAQDLIDYPEWCFHFEVANTTYNKSYAEDNSLGTYHIFSPARYLSERGISAPDILTIALGTNEWYINNYSGWDTSKIFPAVEWMIRRFREAMPLTKIVVMPCNNFPIGREQDWTEKASLLAAKVLDICEEKIANGDNNLFTLSTFANGSRYNAHRGILSESELSLDNSAKIATLSSDVHAIDAVNQSRFDYMKSLSDCVICLA